MSEHLHAPDRERLSASVMVMCEYACEWADDATLFALVSVLAQHACRSAELLAQQHYQAMHETFAPQVAQAQMAMRTPALTNEAHSILMPQPPPTGQPG